MISFLYKHMVFIFWFWVVIVAWMFWRNGGYHPLKQKETQNSIPEPRSDEVHRSSPSEDKSHKKHTPDHS